MTAATQRITGCPPGCACLCHTDIDDHGPTHLPTCAWSDPEYDGGGPLPSRVDVAIVFAAVSGRKSRRKR